MLDKKEVLEKYDDKTPKEYVNPCDTSSQYKTEWNDSDAGMAYEYQT